jgi:hypothetical protein
LTVSARLFLRFLCLFVAKFSCHKLPRAGVLTIEQRRRAGGGWN